MIKPDILIGVRVSWKARPAAAMVMTSLNIPAIDKVTTEVRWSRANSAEIMEKAMAPGKRRSSGPSRTPFLSTKTPKPWKRLGKPSTGTAMQKRLMNMTGAR